MAKRWLSNRKIAFSRVNASHLNVKKSSKIAKPNLLSRIFGLLNGVRLIAYMIMMFLYKLDLSTL
jgi:hypothetical protein